MIARWFRHGLLFPMMAGLVATQWACGTLVNGSYQNISVRSNPPGAAITIQCKTTEFQEHSTPTDIQVHRKAEPCAILLTKEGYEEIRIELKRKSSHAPGWNVAAFGILGFMGGMAVGTNDPIYEKAGPLRESQKLRDDAKWLVGGLALGGLMAGLDYWTGGAYRREPAEINVTLKPVSANP